MTLSLRNIKDVMFHNVVDEKAKLLMFGTTGSLNVAIACSDFLYEAVVNEIRTSNKTSKINKKRTK